MARSPRTDPSCSPAAAFIAETLAERIRAGRYRAGERLPAERGLAEEFRVSRATFRQALAELERRGLLRREPGCRPLVAGEAARPAARAGRRSIGLWIPSNPNNFGGAMTTRGVQGALDPAAYRLVIGGMSGIGFDAAIRSEAEALLRMAEDEDIAGIILWYLGDRTNLPALAAVRAAGIPLVFVDRRPPAGFEADHVGVENEFSAREVVSHLVSLGHRRIAHLTNADPASTVVERLAGYRQALAAAGLPLRPEWVLTAPFVRPGSDHYPPAYAEIVDRLLALPERPTAVFAVNDYHALSLSEALRERGLAVPGDMAVAGFDDVERWSPGRSFLTSARQPFEQMGAAAAKLMLARLEGEPQNNTRHILLHAPLVARESTLGAGGAASPRGSRKEKDPCPVAVVASP